jgi:GTPase SAR1 family protein
MGVGKTSICNVLCNPNSADHVRNTNSYRPTVEDEFVVNTRVEGEDGLEKKVQLTVLDTMGNDNQNMGVQVPDRFVTSKDGFIVVYDVSCKRSFTQATTFLEQLINDNNIAPDEYAILLVGNKKDKVDNPEKLKEIEDRVEAQKRRMEEQDDYYDEADLGIVDDEEAHEFCDENFLLEPLFISATSSTDVGHVFNILCQRMEVIAQS